ncbi:transposase [Streptosporangium sp. NPDC049376]|uniref:transposase n=1 Tax=Streptosporangium sp. NPDC049376 TaxID=3366192 RepID=UPI003788D619
MADPADEESFAWLAPMVLWPYAEPLLPPAGVRPQGGGMQRIDQRTVFAAVQFVLNTGIAWRALPRLFGVSWQNCHRRFVQWTDDGLWPRLEEAVAENGPEHAQDWARIVSEQVRGRLRERRGVSAAPDVWVREEHGETGARPTVRRVHRALAQRLFWPHD